MTQGNEYLNSQMNSPAYPYSPVTQLSPILTTTISSVQKAARQTAKTPKKNL